MEKQVQQVGEAKGTVAKRGVASSKYQVVRKKTAVRCFDIVPLLFCFKSFTLLISLALRTLQDTMK